MEPKPVLEVSPDGQVIQIPLSDQERISGEPTVEHLQQAILALHRDGVVILNNAMDTAHIDIINSKMSPNSYGIPSMPKADYGKRPEYGNYTQYPYVWPEYLFEDVYANGIIAKVVTNMLGLRPQLRWINGNLVLGGEVPQAIHADLDFDDHLDFCFAITANFYLIDAGPENGVTEWWVGTHHFGVKGIREETGRVQPYIRQNVLEERRKICPPVRPFIPKGSVVLRDLRIWHGGYPNPTGIPRIMLGWIYFARWYENKSCGMYFPESARRILEKYDREGEVDIMCAAKFIPDPEFDTFKVPFRPRHNGAGRGVDSGWPLEDEELEE